MVRADRPHSLRFPRNNRKRCVQMAVGGIASGHLLWRRGSAYVAATGTMEGVAVPVVASVRKLLRNEAWVESQC